MIMWAAILPLDAAKTRIQTAYPGSPHDVGVLRQLRLIHREGGGWVGVGRCACMQVGWAFVTGPTAGCCGWQALGSRAPLHRCAPAAWAAWLSPATLPTCLPACLQEGCRHCMLA